MEEAIKLEEEKVRLKALISSVLFAKTPSKVGASEGWSGAQGVPVFNHRSEASKVRYSS